MFRRASSFIMPTDAEKASRAHDKKIAAEAAETKKQQKLAQRREMICNEAQKTTPKSMGKSPVPDSPPLHAPLQRTESTGETPFKGAKRSNPLNEKRDKEKEQEKIQLAAISDAYGVNMSDAKVMLAKNPTLKRPAMRRNRTSEGELSFGSSSSVNTASSPPPSPLGRMPSYTRDAVIPTSAPSGSPKRQQQIGTPKSPQSYFSSPKMQAQEDKSPEISPKLLTHSPVLRATRPRIAHLPTQMSTLSIDTSMIRPMKGGYTSSNNTPTGSSFVPSSPLRHDMGSPRSAAYSMYTPNSRYEEFGGLQSGPGTPADERNYLASYMTPRLTTGRWHGREASYFNTKKQDDDTASITETEIFEMAARV